MIGKAIFIDRNILRFLVSHKGFANIVQESSEEHPIQPFPKHIVNYFQGVKQDPIRMVLILSDQQRSENSFPVRGWRLSHFLSPYSIILPNLKVHLVMIGLMG